MQKKWRDPLHLNSLLTISLVASGALALLLAPFPGYVSPLYPPAGIALAALLVYGRRVLPSVGLASFIIPLLASWHAHAPGNLGLALLGAIGPIIQSIAGAWIMRRIGIWPGSLDSVRSVISFCCVVAPVSCLISATLSTPILLGSGALNETQIFDNWIAWWAGDTLGVLLFTPISLSIIGSPTQEWQGRWRGVALPLFLCSIVIVAAMLFVRQRENIRTTTAFHHNASQLANMLSVRLSAQMDMLMAVERFASSSQSFALEDWTRITKPWLERYPGTQNLTWNPRVLSKDRQMFESRMRAQGFPGFHIVDRNAAGQILPPGNSQEYLPIVYVDPLAGNERAIGVNVLSLPASARAIEQSRQSGRPVATEPIRLVQATASPHSIVVYQAVFEQPDNIRSALRGTVSVALRFDEVIHRLLDEAGNKNIALCLLDRTAPHLPLALYGPLECHSESWLDNHIALTRQFDFASRTWQVLVRGSLNHPSYSNNWTSGATSAVSLCFSGMLSAFLLMMSGRTRRIEEQVSQRTAELASATSQLRDQKASLAQAQRIARMGSWEIYETGQLHCSDEFRRLLGLPTSGHLLLQDVLTRLELDDRNRLTTYIQEAGHAPQTCSLDRQMTAYDTERQILHFQIESESISGSQLRVHGTVQNVTATRQAEAHIQFLARFDPLTGLPNRSHWQDMARAALNAARRHNDQAAVLFLDLDHFKTINDSLGHSIGDILLAAVADRLKEGLRAEDILARQGGDEFVLLLPRLHGPEEVRSVAAKLVKRLAEPMQLNEHELTVSVSIGIAYYPDDGEDLDTLLKHADVAMYSAKQLGRNNFQFFVPAMNQRVMERLEMETALRRAIERNELTLYFQPQLDLPSNRINACEALVRWQHPEKGLVQPSEFIPQAEESGLILPLGDWVLQKACQQAAYWINEGIDISVAINISALQFRQTDFAQKVARIIAETGADPHRIELEITESALLGSTDYLVESLKRLRGLGISLALDDFGTGYSCLSYLKRLPIERLKIDRSFVKDLPGDAEDAAIASATLSMARDLGMEVIAEGVENEAQLNYLKVRKCRAIQGYLISEPLPASALMAWLKAHPTLPLSI